VSPLLRDCIAHAVEAGRAQGQAEQCLAVEAALTRLLADGGFADLHGAVREIAARLEAQRAVCQGVAVAAESAVERLARELEHPGARIARRVVRAARAAAEAWRGQRPS
jgi:hypothetical protein